MKAFLFVTTIALAACTKPGGGPLKYTFDNAKIASVPLDGKQGVAKAEQSHDQARAMKARAADGKRESEIEADVAEYQAKRAELVSQVVALRVTEKPPQASGDAAALARRAAEAKVGFARARHEWLEQLASSTVYAAYAAQAQLELERAKVAQANRLVAADFTVDAYQKQADAREQAARSQSDAVENERKNAEAKLAVWAQLEDSYLTANGVKGPLESARYAAEWKPPPAPLPPPAEPAPAPAPAPATTTTTSAPPATP